jgi:hypothetical protein
MRTSPLLVLPMGIIFDEKFSPVKSSDIADNVLIG